MPLNPFIDRGLHRLAACGGTFIYCLLVQLNIHQINKKEVFLRYLLFSALFFSASTLSCLNEFHPDILVRIIDADEKAFMLGTNSSVKLILERNYASAIEKLLELESKYPNRYETATNLGTAFELNGDVDNALIWIKKGIELNPSSHKGTEWLHYEILMTKKKMEEDPDYLVSNSIFDVSSVSNFEGIKALNYQLAERTKIIQPPNKLIADLYYLQGLLHEKDGNEILMRSSFNNSIKYGDLRSVEIGQKISAEYKINIEPLKMGN